MNPPSSRLLALFRILMIWDEYPFVWGMTAVASLSLTRQSSTTMMDAGSLLDTTEGILRGVAEEAWSQFVAKEISRRKDFEDLRGIDLAVFRQSQRRLDGKTRAFLQPIQDGSFLDSKAQSKFDMAKERNCSRCGVEDTHEHRCFHCVKFASVHARHREIIDTTLRMQSSLRAHLLPSRNPEWRGFKHFLNTPEMVERRAWVAAS